MRGQVESVYRLDGDQALLVRLDGELRAGDTVHARVDAAARRPTMANHTGTHLLQRALRNRLGEHVQPGRLRRAPRRAALRLHASRAGHARGAARGRGRGQPRRARGPRVHIFETSQDEARELGATMLFGEKYGDIVRVVDITGYSMELCGGTHVRSTAEVGPFTIVRESSVGQGVRRIEAITGPEALGALRARRPRGRGGGGRAAHAARAAARGRRDAAASACASSRRRRAPVAAAATAAAPTWPR